MLRAAVRLRRIYALLDAARVIRREHIEAGLAVWDYAERSAAHIFGGLTGDPLADRLFGAIRDASDAGADRSELGRSSMDARGGEAASERDYPDPYAGSQTRMGSEASEAL